MLADVDDQRGAGRLAALLVPAPRASTGTSSRARRDGGRDVLLGARRHKHADRQNLVDRRIGGVASARGGVEQHLAAVSALQAAFESGDRPWRDQTLSGQRSAWQIGLPARISSSTASRLRSRCSIRIARSGRHRALPERSIIARAHAPRASTWRPSVRAEAQRLHARVDLAVGLGQQRILRRVVDRGVDERRSAGSSRTGRVARGRPASRSAAPAISASSASVMRCAASSPDMPFELGEHLEGMHSRPRSAARDRAAIGQQVDQAFGGQQLDRLAQRRARDVQLLAELALVELAPGRDRALRPAACAAAPRPARAAPGGGSRGSRPWRHFECVLPGRACNSVPQEAPSIRI